MGVCKSNLNSNREREKKELLKINSLDNLFTKYIESPEVHKFETKNNLKMKKKPIKDKSVLYSLYYIFPHIIGKGTSGEVRKIKNRLTEKYFALKTISKKKKKKKRNTKN